MLDRTVIVGAGHAGTTLAASLRENGYDGHVVLVGAEPELPYHRPPLSKTFLATDQAEAQLLRPDRYYADNSIELHRGEAVRQVDLAGRHVILSSGHRLPFDRLGIATGGRPRLWPGFNSDVPGVAHLRTLADARRIKSMASGLGHLVLVGGGFIGLELAATLSQMGVAVTLIEATDRLVGRAIAMATSRHLLDLHRGWGVEILLGEALGRIVVDSGRVRAVETSLGRRIDTSAVVVGIGIDPEVELCRAAGLDCRDGIVVDDYMIAGRAGIVAAGDCVNFRHWLSGTHKRVESVQNATDQARIAARSLMGYREPYRAVPWFWSDQRQMKLQIAGLAEGVDADIVRGNPADGRFSVFRYRGDRLVAVDSVNRPGEHLVARRLIAAAVSPSRAQAADAGFDLKALLAPAAADRVAVAEASSSVR